MSHMFNSDWMDKYLNSQFYLWVSNSLDQKSPKKQCVVYVKKHMYWAIWGKVLLSTLCIVGSTYITLGLNHLILIDFSRDQLLLWHQVTHRLKTMCVTQQLKRSQALKYHTYRKNLRKKHCRYGWMTQCVLCKLFRINQFRSIC